ncbi:sigma-70 family RNA polymerase sigma factor [Butyricicoccus sp.]|uniref:sigma-70 family RNA polymerase sigma factor n=1 Tax=Butyricicoccus sp. TaxID=2049021 RepID=UPI003F1554A4
MFDENSIVDRILSGDDSAFERLVDRYEHKVYQYALRFLGRQEDACIATEEIFYQIYRKIQTCTDTKLSTWVFRIAANVCAEYQHRRRGSKSSVLSDVFHLRGSSEKEEDLNEGIQVILLRLTRQQREVLLLRDLCGLNDEETGQVLGLDENGVRQRLSRARKNLRELLLRQGILEQPEDDTAPKQECQHYRELCSQYVDECISDPDKEALLDHIQECPACAAYLADLTRIGRSLTHMEEEAPPQELREKIITAARRQAEHVQQRRRRAAHWPLIAVLCFTAVMLALLCNGTLGGLFVNSYHDVTVPRAEAGEGERDRQIAPVLEEEIIIPDAVASNSYAFVIAAEGNTNLPELSASATLLAGDAGDGVEYYVVDNDLNLVQKLTDGMESVGYEMETVNNNRLVISSSASQGLFIVIHRDS